MATAISQLALAHLYQHAPVVRPHGKKVMVACVEGELHDFPARMVTDALHLACLLYTSPTVRLRV